MLPCRLILHVTSDGEREASTPRFPKAQVAVIPNGVVVPERNEAVVSGEFRMVFLGRLDPIKGIDRLIAACGLLHLQRPWRLTIAGWGTPAFEEWLDDQIRSAGLCDRIRRVGPLAASEKAAFFAEADVLILPSHSENFGIVVAEALVHGVPVIVSTGTPWARVHDVDCGISVANDPISLADAISRLSQADLVGMGNRGREWMCREFSWESVADRVESVYRSFVRPHSCLT